MKSTEEKMFKSLKIPAEEELTTPQLALPASLRPITNQFDFYHASTEVVIVNEQRFKWKWFIEFHFYDDLLSFKGTMIVVSVCFSWALDPWFYNTTFPSGCCNRVFI